MSCAVEARHRCRAAAELLGADPRTAAVDVLPPGIDPHNAWVVKLVLEGESSRRRWPTRWGGII